MSGPAYPLSVALPGGRVRHDAKLTNGGPYVVTLRRKRGVPISDGASMPYCSACAKRPNPWDQRSYLPATDTTKET